MAETRRQTETKDLLRARQLVQAVEGSRNLVVTTDSQGHIEWVNLSFTRLLGYSLDDVRGRLPCDFLLRAGVDVAASATLRDGLARGEPFHTELRVFTQAGAELWVDLDIQPMRDPSGAITHLVVVAVDLTARKAAEAAQTLLTSRLKERVEKLRVMLDGTEHAVIATDERGLVTFFNRGAELMLGWSGAEVMAVKTPAAFHQFEELRTHALMVSAQLGGTVEPGIMALLERARRGISETREWTWQRKDGSQLTVSLAVTAMRDPSGGVDGFLCVASDMTATRQAEAGWRDYIERLVKLSSHLPGVLYQFQRFPDGRMCFPWASDGLRDVYGVSPNEVRTDATSVFETLHPEDREQVESSIAASAQNLSRWQLEYRVRRADGTVSWLLGNATPDRQDDGSVLWHGYISDITERKAFENELVRAREAALGASRVKSEFLANMSHEIRTPLNGILGMTQLLFETSPSTEQREFLAAVQVSGHTLLTLINDILDLSKVESGRLEFESVPFSPREVLQRVVQTVSVRAEEKGLRIRLDVDAAVPAYVMGDPTRVFQVLLNLAGNAVKFTERGEVRLAARAPTEGALHIDVVDTGIGIAEDKIPRLFAPFTQGDGSITRRYGGTGLGLAISRKLAEHMGGALRFSSVEGVGSRFEVEFPLATAQREVVAPKASAPLRAARSMKVLLAEDNAINALVVRRLLERDGHAVVHVMTGAAAVEATAHESFDLVFMDVQMPELDGLEATRQIRQRERARGGRVAICALTANAMKGDLEHCREAGMDDYLTKPVDLALMREKLRSLQGSPPGVTR